MNIFLVIWDAATPQIRNRRIAIAALGLGGISQYAEAIHSGAKIGHEAIKSTM
jgi:hypothetical protein